MDPTLRDLLKPKNLEKLKKHLNNEEPNPDHKNLQTIRTKEAISSSKNITMEVFLISL